MAIGLLIPSTGGSTAQPTSSMSTETGPTQRTERDAFSVLLKDAVKNINGEKAPALSDPRTSVEPVLSPAVDDHASGVPLIGLVVVTSSQVPDPHEVASTVADQAESLPTANTNVSVNPSSTSSPHPTESMLQSSESIPSLPQIVTAVALPDDGTRGKGPVAADPSQAKAADSSSLTLPQPVLDPNQSSEVPATQVDVPPMNKPSMRNGRGTPAHPAPIPLAQASDASALFDMRPPSSLIPEHGALSTMENQGSTNLLPTAQGQGQGNTLVQPLVRPSPDIRPGAITEEQGNHETTLLSQSLSVRVIEEGEGWKQGSFGDSAQGDAEGSRFQFNAGGTPEWAMRGHQSPLFSDQLMSARQTQSLPQGTGSAVEMSTGDHLKLAQSLLGGEHPATMTSIPQTIHLELPSHDSGPLNVRISMMDQTVHTQFTTDRSDLGALLFMRQDQLQQNLIKSGLELGQFQVHVNQEGRQDALPDRQSRRNDGTPDQQLASQGHNPQAHDRERPHHRPVRTLSLFA
jgi:Flagellar hook-length control protein FliK